MDDRRGRWDRSVGGEARADAHRSVILGAAARIRAASDGPLTVTDVVALAGIGRNTFYEHFEDADAVVAALDEIALRDLEDALDAGASRAATPIARLRSVASACLEYSKVNPESATSIFGGHVRSESRQSTRRILASRLTAILAGARSAGTVGRVVDDARLAAIAGAYEAVAARVATETTADVSTDVEALVDLTLRAFR